MHRKLLVYLGAQIAFAHYLCCYILLQNRLRWFVLESIQLAVKWTVTPTCWLVIDMISSASALGSAGKGSRLPDLGSDYKPPMSGKALSKTFFSLLQTLWKFCLNFSNVFYSFSVGLWHVDVVFHLADLALTILRQMLLNYYWKPSHHRILFLHVAGRRQDWCLNKPSVPYYLQKRVGLSKISPLVELAITCHKPENCFRISTSPLLIFSLWILGGGGGGNSTFFYHSAR